MSLPRLPAPPSRRFVDTVRKCRRSVHDYPTRISYSGHRPSERQEELKISSTPRHRAGDSSRNGCHWWFDGGSRTQRHFTVRYARSLCRRSVHDYPTRLSYTTILHEYPTLVIGRPSAKRIFPQLSATIIFHNLHRSESESERPAS